MWNTVETHGEQLPPLRAHTATLVGGLIYVFGGGDGPSYSNEVWVFDTVSNRWSRPTIATPRVSHPLQRRAHTACLYRNFIVVFGGGNGQAALNDVWALDVSDPQRLTWHEWRTRGDVPPRKGYHSASLVGDRMVVYGGSDGHASFADVHVLNLRTLLVNSWH
jgi:N-acetylneuraminic acid mutarotase